MYKYNNYEMYFLHTLRALISSTSSFRCIKSSSGLRINSLISTSLLNDTFFLMFFRKFLVVSGMSLVKTISNLLSSSSLSSLSSLSSSSSSSSIMSSSYSSSSILSSSQLSLVEQSSLSISSTWASL